MFGFYHTVYERRLCFNSVGVCKHNILVDISWPRMPKGEATDLHISSVSENTRDVVVTLPAAFLCGLLFTHNSCTATSLQGALIGRTLSATGKYPG